MRTSFSDSESEMSVNIDQPLQNLRMMDHPSLPGPPEGSTYSPLAPKGSQLVFPTTRITCLTPSLFRFESSPDGKFEDRASTFAINRSLPSPKLDVERKKDGGVEVTTETTRIIYDGKGLTRQGLRVVSIQSSNDWRWGQEVRGNLGGTARTLDTIDGRIDMGDGILSQGGFAVIDDTETMLFTPEGFVDSRTPGKTDHYLFAYGTDYRAALRDFYKLSGSMPVVPRWALGNWWSRYHPYSDQEYIDLMDKFKDHKIPLCVGVLDMDWHLVSDVPKEYGSGWTGYTWNKKLFPDPKEYIKRLHDRNLKMAPNTHPADGFRAYEDVYEKACEILGRDPKTKRPIDFDVTDPNFMSAYFKIHHILEESGIDFWWLDWQQGNISRRPGIDPLWVLNHFHFWDMARNGTRPMTFSRYGGPGSHRYPVGFSGDTQSTWASLEFQPEFTATAANVGYGWWSHDIGGHWGGTKNNEMFARWVQSGLWSPILRLHCSLSDFNSREPWRYNKEADEVVTASMQLRHRLIPYLYTMSVRSAREGICICEPMYHQYPNVPEAYHNKCQYFFGSQLIVAPIVEPRDNLTMMGRSEVWLPEGKWVDIFTNTIYDGDRLIPMYRTLQKTPALAKPGAIIPFDATCSYDEHSEIKNGAPLPEVIDIVLVVGADGSFELLEDDGQGADLKAIEFSKTLIEFDQESGVMSIGPTTNPLVEKRQYRVNLPGFKVSEGFSPQMLPVSGLLSPNVNVETQEECTILTLPKISISEKVKLSIGASPQLKANDVKGKVFAMLDLCQTEIQVKDLIFPLIKRHANEIEERHILLSQLEALNLDGRVKEAIFEITLAQ